MKSTILSATLFAATLAGCAADGASGEQGEQGPPGMDGETASGGYFPVLWWTCNESANVVDQPQGVTETLFRYSGTIYSNGDIDVSCEVSLGLGDTTSASGGFYFPSGTRGGIDGSCRAGVNYPPDNDGVAGHWAYEATGDGETPTVIYSDVTSHPLDGVRLQFPVNSCVVLSMNPDTGEWSETTFAEVYDSE